MNVVYPFVDNPISVYVPGHRADSISVVPSFGKIKDNGWGKFMYSCDNYTTTGSVIFKIYFGEKEIGSYSVRLKPFPSPIFLFNGYENPVVTITGSKDSTMTLGSVVRGMDFDVKTSVKSFEFDIIRNGDVHQTGAYQRNDSMAFNQIKINLSTCEKGDILYIKNLLYNYVTSGFVHTDSFKKDLVLLIN